MRTSAALFLVAILTLVRASTSAAQTGGDLGEIHGLKLGLKARAMILDGWGELACGSDGGPSRQEIAAWSGFKVCRAEASGLHEVYARFDDEEEYVAKAFGEPAMAGQRTGTRVAGHPVVLSALFDDGGVLRGIRMLSDPRATPAERRMAHLLGDAVIERYGPDGWTCIDLPPAEGESAVGGVFIKRHCTKTLPERALTVETHLLRKPGQHDVDPETQEYTKGEFDSSTRFELYDPSYRQP
jgi:hypothetical protein